MSGPVHTFRLSYGDCDAVGLAYFAIFYPWMERAYSCWMHDRGISSDRLPKDFGIGTVGVHSEATYLQQVRVFDALHCEMLRDRVGRTSYTLAFPFRREGELVTLGRMTFACRTLDGHKTPVPDRFVEVLGTLPQLADSLEHPHRRHR
jgi:acyl-CoA thioesterase FadM